MSSLVKRPEKKEAVEKLQETHLQGPADEPIEVSAELLKEGVVVEANEIPRMENITFRNQRDPGHVLEFHYFSKTHPFRQYKLIDGKQYQLPFEVIKNLEGCREEIHKYKKNEEGIPEIYVAGYKSHFACERA